MHVLQHFGQSQVIPLEANTRVCEIPFGPNFDVPRARENLNDCNNILMLDIRNALKREISEYQMWFREDRSSMSPKGEQGFEDIGTTIWIMHSHLGTKKVTPKMWA